jgi:glutathione S-transferase
MKLFIKPGSCSLASHIVLKELGLPCETEVVDTKAGKTASGSDYSAINPKGYVPALQLDDGTVLTEGPAILQYLADQAPAGGLVPENGSVARYQVQGWLNYIGSELHKNFSPFFNPVASDEWKETCRASLQKRFAYVDDCLKGKDFLMGAQFTIADAYLFVVSNWAKFVKFDLTGFANLTAFQARVHARPAVQAAMKGEGLKV